MQVRILVSQLAARGLGPDHEGVHGAFDVRFPLLSVLAARRCGDERPVVPFQHV